MLPLAPPSGHPCLYELKVCFFEEKNSVTHVVWTGLKEGHSRFGPKVNDNCFKILRFSDIL